MNKQNSILNKSFYNKRCKRYKIKFNQFYYLKIQMISMDWQMIMVFNILRGNKIRNLYDNKMNINILFK